MRLSGHLFACCAVSLEKRQLDLIIPAHCVIYHNHQISITFEPCHVISNCILTCVDSDEPVQPPVKLRVSK